MDFEIFVYFDYIGRVNGIWFSLEDLKV